MTKKRIRQMNGALRRRLTSRPAADWLPDGESFARTLEAENYMQRFAPLFHGVRLRCAEVLALCRPELDALSGGQEPARGWLAYAYDFACRLLYPEEDADTSYAAGAVFLLSVLQVLFAAEDELLPRDPAWTFDFPTEEELSGCACAASLGQMLRSWKREYVYEQMRLGLEATPYRTLEHIAGVHHVAMTAARGLRRAGIPLDLALVSGSAAGHDIGKFGCRPGERVPYLHYYYTDLWFRRRRITDIGHVAANHSVWDLEPDYLSVESLLLIYADFRVKQSRDSDGREITRISSLAEAFDVILSKLDGVDDAKRRRYMRVYARLRDFEQFMVDRGVDVTLQGHDTPPRPEKQTALMTDDEALHALTMQCVGHNMELMSRLTGQRSFARLLELARGETNWRRLRAYLGVFESYSLYLHIPQKVQTLAFLYELLMHREGDIRRQAAALLGEIIGGFHAGYAKERPAGSRPDPRGVTDLDQWKLYLDKIIYPDHKLMPQHRRWIGYTLKFAVTSLLRHAAGREERFLTPLFSYYRRPDHLDDATAFQLLDAAVSLPDTVYARHGALLLRFAETLSVRQDVQVRTAAVLLLDRLRRSSPRSAGTLRALARMDCGGSTTLRLLREDVLQDGAPITLPDDAVSEIFLDNLKTATPWITKQANIRLLTDFARSGSSPALHIATHLSNLIKVSDRVTVRHSAGSALLELAPRLTVDQRNEVAVELCRGLELGQQEFTKYIPDYLGRFALWLPPAELDEVLDDLWGNLSASDSRVAASVLDTVGIIYETYDAYRTRFPETDDAYRRRRQRLLGMLMRGLYGIDNAVRQEALYVLGRRVFGSAELGDHEKCRAFVLTERKLLAAYDEEPDEGLTFYYRAAMLGKLYRFMTEEQLFREGFDFGAPRPVAFFPGTFDPFTLSHKGIVRAIRDAGFEVLLAIDEFSWSKRTQPTRIRRRIAAMSVANEFHVHLFPEDFPVNIANPDNLRRLRQAFPGRRVSIVVGSDVVAHASSYRKAPTADSIHTFDHVIFRREELGGPVDYGCIRGRVVELTLPPQLEEISSTRIREAVDANRDISRLVDPAVQDFIYRRGLYLREPQDKPMLQTEDLEFSVSQHPAEELLPLLRELGPDGSAVARAVSESGDQAVLLHRSGQTCVLGAVTFRCLDSQILFSRLKSPALTGLVRQSTGGRALLVSGLLVPRGEQQEEFGQLLLTEVLTLALSREYAYGLYVPLEGAASTFARQLMLRQGFVPVSGGERDALAVDMRRPLVLSRNADTAIKQPLASRPAVAAAVSAARIRLQEALTGLYPGNLVLSLSAGVIYHRLLQRITARNGVPAEPLVPRQLGPDICVPYGKILRGVTVPNTVTKTLRTDKVYEPDLSAYSIEAYPGYSPLPDQVRTIRAFDRPVILVDDMLHDGKRIRRLAPLLEQTHTRVDQVLVGYLTGMGRDLMDQLGYPVDSIYYLPNLRRWFVESTLYPFIGGDTVRRTGLLPGGLQPSVNRILPYASPELPDVDSRAVWQLSLCCLENARDILLALEAEYRSLYARNLTLARLGEAVILPLCPDKGPCMTYDLTRAASTYLDGDIEQLRRMR